MKTSTYIGAIRIAGVAAALTSLILTSGCIRGASMSGYSDADLQSITNRAVSGEIPAGVKILEVDNTMGPVHVVAADGNAGHWSWKLTVQARTDAAAVEWANATQCAVTRDGGTLRVAVSLPNSSGSRRIESALDLRVPKSVAVRVSNHFGEMTIAGLSGDVEARNQNGSLELRDLPGNVRARTSFSSLTADHIGPATLENQNGRLEVTDVHGDLDARTSFASLVARNISGNARAHDQNGSVELENVAGNADAETSFATLRADNVRGDAALADQNGRVEARSIAGQVKANTSFASMDIESAGRSVACHNQNGSIRVRATSLELSSVEAETSFASLEVRLPSGLKPAIQAHTSFAEVESDFPVILKRASDTPADLEAGTPTVRLHNQNGAIRVVREAAMTER